MILSIKRRNRQIALIRPTHFFSIPFLAAPAMTAIINNAIAAAATALVVVHV